jgi:hypothetical protein
MVSFFSQYSKYFIRIIAGDKRSAALDCHINALLILDGGTNPRINTVGTHLFTFRRGRYIQRCIYLAEHTAAVSIAGRINGILPHKAEGEKDVLTVRFSVLFINVLMKLCHPGIDDNAVAEAVFLYHGQRPVTDIVRQLLA